MTLDYPAVYRRGSQRYDGGRLSNTAGNAALENERNARAEATFRKFMEDRQRMRQHPGQSPIPRSSADQALKRAGRDAVRKFPLVSLLRAAASMANDIDAQSYPAAVGMNFGGQTGVCAVVEPLDYSDHCVGLPSTACNLGQACDPTFNYAAYWALGVGNWYHRAVGFNYDQTWYKLPAANYMSEAAWIVLFEKAGGVLVPPYPFGMGVAGLKMDPTSNPDYHPSALMRTDPYAHPHVDPLAVPVGAWPRAAVALPTILVTNRSGVGPGVGGEQSSWSDGTTATTVKTDTGTQVETKTDTDTTKLPIAPHKVATRLTKERKAVVGRTMLRIMGQLTEEFDAIAAVYPCVPKKYRKKVEFRGRKRPVSLEEKAKMVYDHWDEIHLGCAAFNLLWERVEDTAYAKISQHSKNPYPLPGSVSGGRSLEVSRQGDADLPHGQLPLSDLKKWLQEQTGWKG